MKKSATKTSHAKKLVLRRETIVSLVRDELALVVGGLRATDTGSGAVCLTTLNTFGCD